MTTLEDAQTILDSQQDYYSRLIILFLLLFLHIFLYYYSDKFSNEFDWQRLRNWLLKIYSFVILLAMILIFPLFLTKGYTFELMLNTIINFYKIGLVITSIIIFIWFKDIIMDIISKVFTRFNPRKNYIFGSKNRRKK